MYGCPNGLLPSRMPSQSDLKLYFGRRQAGRLAFSNSKDAVSLRSSQCPSACSDCMLMPSRPLTPAIARNFAAQIFLACQYLHSHHIAWTDLELCNVVVTPQLGIKIIYFGQSYSFKDFHFQYHRSQQLRDLQRFASSIFFLSTGMGSFYHALTFEEMQIAVDQAVQRNPARSTSLQALLKLVEPLSTGRLSYDEADENTRKHFGIGSDK